jgi:hypothetical protein
MFAEFIYQPNSGQYPEKHFGEISENCLWVRFTDNEYQDWVGSFQQGWNGFGTFIINLDNQEKVFVVAGGKSYLIDISTRKLLNEQEILDTKSAILNDDQTNIYFTSGYDLQFLDLDGKVFDLFDNYYFDDIQLVEIKGNKLFAKYWNYQRGNDPFHIEVDLQTKEIKDTYFIN